jgi:hypothetical protein
MNRENRRTTQHNEKPLPTISKEKSHLVPGTVKLLHQNKKKRSMGMRRAAGLT